MHGNYLLAGAKLDKNHETAKCTVRKIWLAKDYWLILQAETARFRHIEKRGDVYWHVGWCVFRGKEVCRVGAEGAIEKR